MKCPMQSFKLECQLCTNYVLPIQLQKIPKSKNEIQFRSILGTNVTEPYRHPEIPEEHQTVPKNIAYWSSN